jgi:serine phosphatase RsbU (regulator of sigma subunit)
MELKLGASDAEAALPSLPRMPGVDLAVPMKYAREVGGDCYQFIPAADWLVLVVGDVLIFGGFVLLASAWSVL